MKKLLVLFAFLVLLCYVGAEAVTRTQWEQCANKVAAPVVEQCSKDETGCMKNLCDFYQIPMEQCTQVIGSSTDEEVNKIITGYLLYAVIIPACGTPDANQ